MSVLFEYFPALRGRVPWVSLGALPTPVEAGASIVSEARLAGELWLKRDDLSSPVYGGNKLRLLEHLLGQAQAQGMTGVYATGAVGSNFALATALHAPRVGLQPGVICFPQPLTEEGERSHRVVCERSAVVAVAHWSLLPVAAERVRRQEEGQGRRVRVLSQVSLSAESLLGYVAAGLELAAQVARRECPLPSRVVLPVGSAATSGGILAGLSLARKLGLLSAPTALDAVRIAAWPLARRGRIVSLAMKALAGLAELAGDASLALVKADLLPVRVVTDQLGDGYPHATPAGRQAREVFASAGLAILDDTYSSKAAAHVLASIADAPGPVLFWSTKSSAPLPSP